MGIGAGRDPYKRTRVGVDKQSAKVPESAKLVTKALSGTFNRAAIVLLLENPRPWSFEEMCEEFEIDSREKRRKLREALGELQEGTLVRRIEGEGRYMRKYEATDSAEEVLETISEAVFPNAAKDS